MSQAPLHAEAAGTGSPGAAGLPGQAKRGWLTPAGVAILVATVIGLALRLLQLTRPGHLLGVTEYDDGVYFGSAIRLVNGVMPYKDFVLVQPPGLIVLMTPVAALSKLTGSAWGMGIGRLITACAGAASVPLAGLLVRRRGLLAVILTCGIMAVYPDAILAAHTVLQEPWLVLFCLLGLLAVMEDGRLTASRRRLAWGGVAFGFAGAVKLWAILPIVVIAVLCLPGLRRLGVYLAGVIAGFLVPVLPFLIAAPSMFWRGVFLAQVVRVDNARTTLATRLADLSGIDSTVRTRVPISTATAALVIVLIAVLVVGACVAASMLTHRLPSPLESFALVTSLLVLIAFLAPADFYYHYAAFFAPFLALAVGLPVARLVSALQERSGQRAQGLRLETAAAGIAVLALLVMAVVQGHSEAVLKAADDPSAAPPAIPSGACVLTDQVSFTIAAGRFTSSVPGCPQLVDGVGTDLALSQGHNGVSGAAHNPAVRAVWNSAFHKAQYVWLSNGLFDKTVARRIAWTPALRAYFAAHFQRVPGHTKDLYKRIG
jgi:alpha-1,2-mannosyltransferase